MSTTAGRALGSAQTATLPKYPGWRCLWSCGTVCMLRMHMRGRAEWDDESRSPALCRLYVRSRECVKERVSKFELAKSGKLNCAACIEGAGAQRTQTQHSCTAVTCLSLVVALPEKQCDSNPLSILLDFNPTVMLFLSFTTLSFLRYSSYLPSRAGNLLASPKHKT